MPRIDDSYTGVDVIFTSNTSWLEEIDSRRVRGPEELLTFLEDLLEAGELTLEEISHYIPR